VENVSIVADGAMILVLAGAAAIVVVLAYKLFMGLGNRGHQAEDARTIQETYQGLSRLEERVEALETILHDRKDGETEK
jgi:phage shock protein B